MNIRMVRLETDVPGIVRVLNACDPTDVITVDELRAEFQRTTPNKITLRLVAVDENATTGVIRAYRGRKIAQALKIMAARYARQHGAQMIRTDNDSLNAPILAINRKMGYQPQPGTYLLVRWLGEKEQQAVSQ